MITENGLWFCDKCKSLLVEHESWFVEIASEHLCVCCAENEIVGLREQLRWRKWPEEIPENHGLYLTVDCADGLKNLWFDGGWPWPNVTYWRPIGPLPGGE